MRDLNTALTDIRSIRRQLAHATEFRGYGPATLASTAILALAASTVQSRWLPEPVPHIAAYVALWFATAVLSAGLIAVQTYTRTRRIHSGLADEMIRMAVVQFLPAAAAGALLTLVLIRSAGVPTGCCPASGKSSSRSGSSPRAASCRAPWRSPASGICSPVSACLALADDRALSPWVMGIAFAVGQALVAAVLLLHSDEATDEI